MKKGRCGGGVEVEWEMEKGGGMDRVQRGE